MINKIKYILAFVILITGCTLVSIKGHKPRSPKQPLNNAQYAQTAVMITSGSENSGGTGVILNSNPGLSHVLTNKHVCELVQRGGKVITDNGKKYAVDGYRVYPKHDLCLIDVHADLKVNIKVAKNPPQDYETSIVVGHPALLPTMITVGHFSQSRLIELIVDIKECDGSETSDDEMLMCFFMGGKPVFKTFQAQITSSLIMPGSSGSAVYNSQGELSGLIFAGNQDLSYGFLVPWAYVNDFLKNKNRYKVEIPNAKRKPRNFFTAYFKLENFCGTKNGRKDSAICSSFERLGLWYK